MSAELIELTKLLLLDSERALQRFEQAKSIGEKGNFYEEVKPFADKVKQRAEEWEIRAITWLNDHPQRTLHSHQVRSTVENLEMVSVQAFFPETSRKRFMGSIQSIEYVLKDLLETAAGRDDDRSDAHN